MSESPVISGSGTVVAFVTAATDFTSADPNGAIPDVMSIDLATGRRRRVSEGTTPGGADGPSSAPSISRSGKVIAFASAATNLVRSDTNRLGDVFVRSSAGPIARVSVATDGTQANGPSSQPDVSADGTTVAFVSAASNLVLDDHNGVADVFVRDLARGITRRISVGATGDEGNGPSSAPAVDADGRVVSFTSTATNLVPGDQNQVADVFVRDVRRHLTEQVTVDALRRGQNNAVPPPFSIVSDISATGRFVVFDTDATLYRLDRNRHTDVYFRDRLAGTTRLVSASSLNVQGNNDSVTPRVSPTGRYVTFQSFASNLSIDDGPGPDLFVRDLRDGTTSYLNARDGRGKPGREPHRLLQVATISDDARAAVFASAAPGVTIGSTGGPPQIYRRRLDRVKLTLRGQVRRTRTLVRFKLGVDDPAARYFLCRLDQAQPFLCGPNVQVPKRLGRVFSVRAGGPGLLWSNPYSVQLDLP